MAAADVLQFMLVLHIAAVRGSVNATLKRGGRFTIQVGRFRPLIVEGREGGSRSDAIAPRSGSRWAVLGASALGPVPSRSGCPGRHRFVDRAAEGAVVVCVGRTTGLRRCRGDGDANDPEGIRAAILPGTAPPAIRSTASRACSRGAPGFRGAAWHRTATAVHAERTGTAVLAQWFRLTADAAQRRLRRCRRPCACANQVSTKVFSSMSCGMKYPFS